ASFRSPLKAAVIQRGADGTSVSGCPPNSAPRGLPIGWTVRLGRRLSETCFDRYTTTSARCPKAASRSRSRWSRYRWCSGIVTRTVSRHRHEGRPPNGTCSQEVNARSASRWLRLASSAAEATKNRTDAAMDSAAKAFPPVSSAQTLCASLRYSGGAHGHGHLPILGPRLPGRPRRGDREASPHGPPGVEGGHPLP